MNFTNAGATGGFNDLQIGQWNDSASYYCRQGLISWDTSAIPDTDLKNDGVISLSGNYAGPPTNGHFNIHIAQRTWRTSADAADAVAGASLSGLTKLASFNTSGMTTSGYNAFTNTGPEVKSIVDATGYTQVILWSSSQEAGTPIPGSFQFDYVAFWASEASGTGQDPKLVVTHVVGLTAVGDTLDLRWSIRSKVADTLDIRWGVLKTLADTLDLRWSVLAALADTLDLRWSIRAPLADTLDLRWGVMTTLVDTLDLRWAIQANVGDSLDLRWQVLFGNPVGNTLDLRWDVRAHLLDTLDLRWSVLAHASDTLVLLWSTEFVILAYHVRRGWVAMRHFSIANDALVTKQAYDEVWQPEGWIQLVYGGDLLEPYRPPPLLVVRHGWVLIEHADIEDPQLVTQAAFDQVWSDEGWTEVV
jgi:hypothetical protein